MVHLFCLCRVPTPSGYVVSEQAMLTSLPLLMRLHMSLFLPSLTHPLSPPPDVFLLFSSCTVTCSQCSDLFHPNCVKILPGSPMPASFVCTYCKDLKLSVAYSNYSSRGSKAAKGSGSAVASGVPSRQTLYFSRGAQHLGSNRHW